MRTHFVDQVIHKLSAIVSSHSSDIHFVYWTALVVADLKITFNVLNVRLCNSKENVIIIFLLAVATVAGCCII